MLTAAPILVWILPALFFFADFTIFRSSKIRWISQVERRHSIPHGRLVIESIPHEIGAGGKTVEGRAHGSRICETK